MALSPSGLAVSLSGRMRGSHQWITPSVVALLPARVGRCVRAVVVEQCELRHIKCVGLGRDSVSGTPCVYYHLIGLSCRNGRGACVAGEVVQNASATHYVSSCTQKLRQAPLYKSLWGSLLSSEGKSGVAAGGKRNRRVAPKDNVVVLGYITRWRRSKCMAHIDEDDCSPRD